MRTPHSLIIFGLCLTLSACAFPRKDFSSVPDASVITVRQTGSLYEAIPPECAGMLQPSQYNKADDLRMSIAFGCATYTNLAEQVAQPRDLIHPATYRGQSAEAAAQAATRYRENKVTPLKETQSTNIDSK
ncbi:CpaD family pilus assembly protein [Alcaligenaceae bacterium CGII-47]|nr:CpaD family pilus assembly protein [Alcaligenaceae bacterium CGII-47]